MKILVTGGAGFVVSSVTDALLKKDMMLLFWIIYRIVKKKI
jgi:uncharacterized protein YbjT (DUF2867 family)